MKSFLQHIKEEVLPTVQVADGGLDIEKPAVRAAINAAIAGVVSQPAVTPYVVFNRLSKLLAQYHIVLPRKFLEGDKGVEVFEIRQFGHRMGMTDSGEFINQVPTTHYLFLQYGIITPMGVTYAKPLVGGMFRVTARLVDRAELDRLLDMAEITMSEEAECMQAIAKANAPKDEMHDVTSDPKKVGNKKAVATSEKKSIDEDKDPCWKGYEMVGMKKKGGRKVPNCVPANEENLAELSTAKMAKYIEPAYNSAKDLTRQAGYHKANADNSKHHGDHKDYDKHMSRYRKARDKVDNREVGISRAASKIAKRDIKMRKAMGEETLNELTGKGKLPQMKADYQSAKKSHFRDADWHDARADRAERRGDSKEAEHHMDASYGHEEKAERAISKIKRANALMTRAKASADIKSSKAASKSARAEYKEEALGEGRMPASVIAHKQKLANMSDKEFSEKHGHKSEKELRDMAARHGYGWNKETKTGSDHYVKRLSALQKEETLDEVSKELLGRYIKKAHVSGLGAAAEGEQAYTRKDRQTLRAANKTGEKREQGIERAVDKMTGRARVHAKEEKGDKMTPGFSNRKDFTDIAKEIGTGQGGMTFVPKGDDTKQQTIQPMSPKGTQRVFNEKAPPGAKFERMVKHIKKGYSKDGLTSKEKSIAFATAWKAKNREKGE